MCFPQRSDTTQAVQPQKMTNLAAKFWIKNEEKLYYPYSKNKGQRHGYYELRSALLFSHVQNDGFLMKWLKCYFVHVIYFTRLVVH